MARPPGLYEIRIRGRLGPTALSAFPSMVAELKGSETVLTGLLEDRSAVFGVLGQIEALGLELLGLRQVQARPTSHESPGFGEDTSPAERRRSGRESTHDIEEIGDDQGSRGLDFG